MKQTFKLPHERRNAIAAVTQAPDDCTVQILPPSKTRDQEERYHAMLVDIAQQCRHLNESQDAETWKRLCVDQFRRDTLNDPDIGEYWKGKGLRVIPAIDGSCIVVLGEQTRKFPRKVASAFTTWLFAFGAERSVHWSDPTVVPVEAYAQT